MLSALKDRKRSKHGTLANPTVYSGIDKCGDWEGVWVECKKRYVPIVTSIPAYNDLKRWVTVTATLIFFARLRLSIDETVRNGQARARLCSFTSAPILRRRYSSLRGYALARMSREEMILMHQFFVYSVIALVLSGFSSFACAATPAGHEARTISEGGIERLYLLHVPKQYERAKPMPLVLMLHGFGGTAANAIRETGWSAKADREGFIVVYPQATRPDESAKPNLRNNGTAWNDGSGRFHSSERKIDDVAYIRAVIERTKKELSIDAKRVFVTGFSNGGSMTFRIGNTLADIVTAIAPVASASWADTLQPARKISMLYITGANDPLNPLEGGVPRLAFKKKSEDRTAKHPVNTQIAQWVSALGLPSAAVKDETVNGVRRQTFAAAKEAPQVEFITVDGLGHIWAGGENLLPEFVVGKPTDKLNATDTIWTFFNKHSM
jgi:polyhydroxybutyrate depolymerase